jgi:hypothetical protein
VPELSRQPQAGTCRISLPAFFNPHPEEITVAMKMVSDDPKFFFANGQVDTYMKSYKLRPMRGTTDNMFVGSLKFGKPEWPVAPMTNFTGSVEFSCSKPWWVYFSFPSPSFGKNYLLRLLPGFLPLFVTHKRLVMFPRGEMLAGFSRHLVCHHVHVVV